MPIKWSGWLIFVLIISACTSQQIATPIPTQTLIPPTETATATPTLPTSTPEDLPAPQDFRLTPTAVELQPIIATTFDFDMLLIEFTRFDLASNVDLASDRLELVQVKPRLFVITDCTTGGDSPPPMSNGIEVTWMGDAQTYTYLIWEDEAFVWCDTNQLRGEFLVAVDPIAAELSALARRRVQQETGTPLEEIVIQDVLPTQWQNSSLGCPQDNQTYTDVLIDGYRIVIEDGASDYLFHTDSVQIISCTVDRATN